MIAVKVWISNCSYPNYPIFPELKGMHCCPVGHGFKVGKHPGSQNCGLCSLFLKVTNNAKISLPASSYSLQISPGGHSPIFSQVLGPKVLA
mgnify:CR=1 FL=1